MDYVGPVLRSQGSFGEDGLSRGARGEGLIAGPSLFSVVFKPAGFISFRTITDNWFLVTRRLPEDLLGRDRSPSGPALRRSTRLSEETAQRNPRLNISKKTGSWKVASEGPKVVPKTRALPKPLTQATG